MRECVIATNRLESNVIEKIMYLDLSPSLAHYWLHVAFTRQNWLVNIQSTLYKTNAGQNWSTDFFENDDRLAVKDMIIWKITLDELKSIQIKMNLSQSLDCCSS